MNLTLAPVAGRRLASLVQVDFLAEKALGSAEDAAQHASDFASSLSSVGRMAYVLTSNPKSGFHVGAWTVRVSESCTVFCCQSHA